MQAIPLTARQRQILDFLGSFTREAGYPPTVREICRATGLRSPRSVSQHLQSLERKGYIQRGRDKSRAIRCLQESAIPAPAASERVAALSIRGRVAPGATSRDGEPPATSYLIDRSLFSGSDHFLMKVEGECSVDAHILDGDFVVVSPGSSARVGDLVVVRAGDAVSLERHDAQDGLEYVTSPSETRPVDPAGAPARIIGRVVGVIRAAP